MKRLNVAFTIAVILSLAGCWKPSHIKVSGDAFVAGIDGSVKPLALMEVRIYPIEEIKPLLEQRIIELNELKEEVQNRLKDANKAVEIAEAIHASIEIPDSPNLYIPEDNSPIPERPENYYALNDFHKALARAKLEQDWADRRARYEAKLRKISEEYTEANERRSAALKKKLLANQNLQTALKEQMAVTEDAKRSAEKGALFANLPTTAITTEADKGGKFSVELEAKKTYLVIGRTFYDGKNQYWTRVLKPPHEETLLLNNKHVQLTATLPNGL